MATRPTITPGYLESSVTLKVAREGMIPYPCGHLEVRCSQTHSVRATTVSEAIEEKKNTVYSSLFYLLLKSIGIHCTYVAQRYLITLGHVGT